MEQISDGLHLGLDHDLPERVAVGKGTVVVVSGWCYHDDHRVTDVCVSVDGRQEAMRATGLPRPDVAGRLPRTASIPSALRSGFVATVRIAKAVRRLRLGIVATLADGSKVEAPVGQVELLPGPGCTPRVPVGLGAPMHGEGPRVAICMTTYNPTIRLFRAQVESIVHQSHSNWICLVSDDASDARQFHRMRRILSVDDRFVLLSHTERVGFYRNFERCLASVPVDAEFIALADHDDRWHADKLESLLGAFKTGTLLVYSDLNVVDEAWHLVAPTYWTTRANNYKDFDDLLIANTVTGSASMMRRELLNVILPFPPQVGLLFHDYWIACVALALGHIDYVDRSLYDYVQHSRQVIGHFAPSRPNLRFRLRNSRHFRTALARRRALWRDAYFGDVLRTAVVAETILARCGNQLSPERRRSLRRMATLDSSLHSVTWMVSRAIRSYRRPNVTIGMERQFLRGASWRRYAAIRHSLQQCRQRVRELPLVRQPIER